MEKYHFIAIGGVGMSGLAKYLIEQGSVVSGSDINKNKYTDMLEKMGAKIYIGHEESNLSDDCIVVASTAIKDSNPELQKAKKLGLPIFHRSDLLAKISSKKNMFIGFAGTHGKTTTSGLASYVMMQAGLNPSYVVGGSIPKINNNAQFNNGDFFIAELDESDGTIVKYSPKICIVNNLEADHLDFYKNGLESILETFDKFLSKLDKNSKIIVNVDDNGASTICQKYNTITFGIKNEANYEAKNIITTEKGISFDIFYNKKVLTRLELSLFGEHNIYNALAVYAALNESGITMEEVEKHFKTFTGMGRRFQHICDLNGIPVYDDYAHHPTEIRATLSALSAFEGKNIVAVFQPHRYSRLQNLWNEFIESFNGVSRVVVTDVYAASEDPIKGIDTETFVNELKQKQHCEHISGDIESVAKKLLPTLKENDIVIGLGAGTITNLGKFLQKASEDMSWTLEK